MITRAKRRRSDANLVQTRSLSNFKPIRSPATLPRAHWAIIALLWLLVDPTFCRLISNDGRRGESCGAKSAVFWLHYPPTPRERRSRQKGVGTQKLGFFRPRNENPGVKKETTALLTVPEKGKCLHLPACRTKGIVRLFWDPLDMAQRLDMAVQRDKQFPISCYTRKLKKVLAN